MLRNADEEAKYSLRKEHIPDMDERLGYIHQGATRNTRPVIIDHGDHIT